MFDIDNGQREMEVDRCVIFLKKYGKTIRTQYDNGDVLARKIIVTYNMLYKCPGDPGALGILQAHIEEFKKQEGL